MYNLQFWGAARNVTGSMHLLESSEGSIILDCGIFQGHRAEANEINTHFPFDPGSIKAVVLSHAHLDHCGNLPTLVKQGFKGRIYATPPTVELSQVLLLDSAHIQESDALFLNKRILQKGGTPIEPLYTTEEAQACFPYFEPVDYETNFSPLSQVTAHFDEAGHILGSAMVSLALGKERKLYFTGDIGRNRIPLLRNPHQTMEADYFICESTYGDRTHKPMTSANADLAAAVHDVYKRKSRLIIPAFAVGRTQEMLYYLSVLRHANQIPSIPIYVDSPLAIKAIDIFKKYQVDLNTETHILINKGQDPFTLKEVTYLKDPEDSKKLNTMKGPVVIISASGMCEGGRILHHLKYSLNNPKNIILFVGYQAANTLGRRLSDGIKKVKIYGEEQEVLAEVRCLQEFSAHGDYNDIINYFKLMNHKPVKTFLVHGEESAALALQEKMIAAGFTGVVVPYRGEKFKLL